VDQREAVDLVPLPLVVLGPVARETLIAIVGPLANVHEEAALAYVHVIKAALKESRVFHSGNTSNSAVNRDIKPDWPGWGVGVTRIMVQNRARNGHASACRRSAPSITIRPESGQLKSRSGALLETHGCKLWARHGNVGALDAMLPM